MPVLSLSPLSRLALALCLCGAFPAFAPEPPTAELPCGPAMGAFDDGPPTPNEAVEEFPTAPPVAGDGKLEAAKGEGGPGTSEFEVKPSLPPRGEFLAWARTAYPAHEPVEISSGGEGTVFRVTAADGMFKAVKIANDFEGRLGIEAAIADGPALKELALPKPRYFLRTRAVRVAREEGGHTWVLEQDFFARDPSNPKDTRPARTLGTYLRETKATPAQRRALIKQLIDAADRLNDLHVVHRDLKPKNILVNDKGELKIVDFGKASEGERRRTPARSHIVGTAGYTGAEQLAGKQPVPGHDGYALRQLIWDIVHEELRYEEKNAGTYAVPWPMFPGEAKLHRALPEAGPGKDFDALWMLVASSTVAKTPRARKTLLEDIERVLAAEEAGTAGKPGQPSRDEFFRHYGGLLRIQEQAKVTLAGEKTLRVPYAAARDILESPELIRRFPEGLDLAPDFADRIVVAAYVYRLRAQRFLADPSNKERGEQVGSGVFNPYAHYDALLARVEAVRATKPTTGFRPRTTEEYEKLALEINPRG